MLSAVLAAALAVQAAQEPATGSGNTPLQRRSVGPDSLPVPRTGSATPSTPVTTPEPGPVAGQPSSGVVSYPASFFAAAQASTAREMLDRLPGFSFDQGDSGVRGLSGAGGNVLIDGRRSTSKSDDLESILRRVPASQVERIELIRGGAPGIDMQGKTVLANVVRKTGASTTGVISLSEQAVVTDGRSTPGIRLEATRSQNGRSLEGSFVMSGFFDDGAGNGTRFQRDASGQIIARAKNTSEADGVQGIATAAYERPLFGGRIRINGQLFGQRYFYDEAVDPTFGTGIATQTERDHQNKEKAEVGARFNRDFGDKLGLEANLLETVQGEDYLALFNQPGETDRFREQHSTTETVGRSVLTWRYTPALTFEVGGEGAYNRLSSHTRFAVNGAPIALPAANVVVDELRGEAFGQATWKPLRTLTIEAGLRVEASRIGSEGDVVLQKTLVFPKPRLSAAWSPTRADQFRFRVEKEVGQLNFSDFVASSSLSTGQILAGNPDINPQQAWVIEGAYERSFWGQGAAVITLRHAALQDVVDRVPIFAPSGAYDAPGNLGAGTKDELITALTLPLVKLGVKGGLLKGSATWRRTRVVDPATGQERGISGVRPLDASLAFTQDLPAHKLKWGLSVFGGFRERYYRLSQVETDVFLPLLEGFVEWKPRADLGLRFEFHDLGATFRRGVDIYSGVRGRSALDYTEVRDLSFGPTIYARVRKTF